MTVGWRVTMLLTGTLVGAGCEGDAESNAKRWSNKVPAASPDVAEFEGPDAFATALEHAPDDARLSIRVVDERSTFSGGDGTNSYFAALRSAKKFEGMDGIVLVDSLAVNETAELQVLARRRDTLAEFFAGLPPQWRLSAKFGIRHQVVRHRAKESDEPSLWWRARVVRMDIGLPMLNVVRVDLSHRGEASDVLLELAAADGAVLAGLSRKEVGQTLAVLVGDVIVAAPRLQAPIERGALVIDLGGEGDSVAGAVALRRKLGLE